MASLAKTGKGGPMVQFDFAFDPPLKEFHFAVNRFAMGISNYSTLFGALSLLFQAEMREQFETEGEASGEAWAELSPAYKAWKEDHCPGRPIGVCTTALRQSMTGGTGYSETIGPMVAEFGQDEGADAAAYGPYFAQRRPVLRMTPLWGRTWQKTTHEWVVSEARDAFGLSGQLFAKAYGQRIAGVMGSML
jgi:hypothetical protein